MASPHSETSRIWPALIVHHALHQSYGILIALLAVVLLTAKIHDVVIRNKRIKIYSENENSGDEKDSFTETDSQDSSQLGDKNIDGNKRNLLEFFTIFRTRGFNLRRVKDKKTSVKCVRFNANLELSWRRKYPFRLGSKSSDYGLDNLVTAFQCDGDTYDHLKSHFILRFCSKVLRFSVDTPVDAVYFVNGFNSLRKEFNKNPDYFIHFNDFHCQRESNLSTATSLDDDDGEAPIDESGQSSVVTSVTTTTTDKKIRADHLGLRRFDFRNFSNPYRRREVITLQRHPLTSEE